MSISQSDRFLVGRSDGSAAGVESSIKAAVAQYGPAPGAAKMLDGELQAAKEAVESGRYVIWRNSTSGHDFCARVGSGSRCFCGHDYSSHKYMKPDSPNSVCGDCDCKAFAFVPKRPEEVGDTGYPEGKDSTSTVGGLNVDVNMGMTVTQQNPRIAASPVGAAATSPSGVVWSADGTWADHETLWETREERARDGRPVGEGFFPLSHDADLSDMVFSQPRNKKSRDSVGAERSVKLMPKHLGGLGMSPADVPSFAERVMGAAQGPQLLRAVPKLTSGAGRPPQRGMRSSSCAGASRR
eukprot:CAMPEP_0204471202 /NCGR_PEP_ID=MMETSP0471-20130131/19376_1 /ASSEMBLY_ACC=CAM_ASM_000602 /TAXON_ID=2969 /ORGANISM="Oxyrrhis marina" /LENGTH=296 /DNA_ID=CAMNT_0051473293 /DNA_START=69 /DNA_END=959 /DNA_ORIENTATION=-